MLLVLNGFSNSLAELKGSPVRVALYEVDEGTYGEAECGPAPVYLEFEKGEARRIDYWRLIKHGAACISSFDHRQKYGLPERTDAVKVLHEVLQGKLVTEAYAVAETGDLIFEFGKDVKVQAFNFTGYEVWEMNFPDGAVEYSNLFEKGS